MSLDVELFIMVDTGGEQKKNFTLFEANITHNLTKMAEQAGIYAHLWHPERINVTEAKGLIKGLTEGLEKLKSDPEYYKRTNSPNGWGVYDDFVPFVEGYLNACIENPKASIYVSV